MSKFDSITMSYTVSKKYSHVIGSCNFCDKAATRTLLLESPISSEPTETPICTDCGAELQYNNE